MVYTCTKMENSDHGWNRKVEEAKKRCKAVTNHIENLPLSKITDSCKRTLLRLVNSELKFLSSLSPNFSPPISVNIGYLESIVHILQQPCIAGVSRVCKTVPLSSSGNEKKQNPRPKGIYLDIICMLGKNPVWLIVSDRNPKYISWSASHKNKGLRMRIKQVLTAAQSYSTLKPAFLILFFANGLSKDISQKLRDEFGALDFETELPSIDSGFYEEVDDGWVNVVARSYGKAQSYQIMVDCMEREVPQLDDRVRHYYLGTDTREVFEDQSRLILGDKFCSLISKMSSSSLDVESSKQEALLGADLINFDTTALIALVSGISNGGTGKLLAAQEDEMRKRFKSNFEFVIAQVMSELQEPILEELTCVVSGKIGLICESVHSEFKELVSMCGGPNEKLRADTLLKCLMIVPDCPSARMKSTPTSRKTALKNKVIFGTGDRWRAPTLTANMGFVRAISQTGMSLSTLEHRPRALTGD